MKQTLFPFRLNFYISLWDPFLENLFILCYITDSVFLISRKEFLYEKYL